MSTGADQAALRPRSAGVFLYPFEQHEPTADHRALQHVRRGQPEVLQVHAGRGERTDQELQIQRL